MIEDKIVDLSGFLTLLSHIFIIILLFSYIFKIKSLNELKLYLKKNSLLFSFILSLLAVIGSLFFSEVMGFEACILCWYQRIIVFPLPIILLVALIKKDKNVRNYVLPLVSIGSLIAIYNVIVERTGSEFCDVASLVPCDLIYILQFNYITIPVMSLTFFVLIGILMLNSKSI